MPLRFPHTWRKIGKVRAGGEGCACTTCTYKYIYVQWNCLPAFSNTTAFHICWPTELLFWIDPKPEHLQQNFISTNLFITLLWDKFQRYFLPFKDINQKMCKRVGSTLLHTLHSKSRGKCSLFVFCTQEGVETCNVVSIAWNLSLIFSPLQPGLAPGVTISNALINMKLDKQIRFSSSLSSFSSELRKLWRVCKQKLSSRGFGTRMKTSQEGSVSDAANTQEIPSRHGRVVSLLSLAHLAPYSLGFSSFMPTV